MATAPTKATPRSQAVWIKPLAWLLCLSPLGWLVFRVIAHPPVNPIETVIHGTGEWALRLLCITLFMTPLRRWTGWPVWIRIRRLLGLFAFFYACLHVLSYLGLDQAFDIDAVVRDIVKRPFITVGLLAFILLLPLAATSTQTAMKRLGRRWQRIHSLIYVLTPLAVVHFWWLVKKDIREPLIYAVIVGFLLCVRLWWRLKAGKR